jgi:hypothetical protein
MSGRKSRVSKLEQQREEAGDACPECGLRPCDVRFIEINLGVRRPGDREPVVEPEGPACESCGKPSKVRMVEIYSDDAARGAPLSAPARLRPAPPGD